MAKKEMSATTGDGGLQTPHIFLDTEVFRSIGFNLDNALLKTLAEYIPTHHLKLHTTDITLSEIERQIGEKIAEDAACKIAPNNDPTFNAVQCIGVVDESLIPNNSVSLPTMTPAKTAIPSIHQ